MTLLLRLLLSCRDDALRVAMAWGFHCEHRREAEISCLFGWRLCGSNKAATTEKSQSLAGVVSMGCHGLGFLAVVQNERALSRWIEDLRRGSKSPGLGWHIIAANIEGSSKPARETQANIGHGPGVISRCLPHGVEVTDDAYWSADWHGSQ